MTKRVVVLTGESPDVRGGMERVILEMIEIMGQHGYEVNVLHRRNAAPHWMAQPATKWQSYAADGLLSWYLGRRTRDQMGDDVVAVLSNAMFGWYLPGVPAHVKKIHFYHGTYRGQATGMAPFISRAGALKLAWWDSMVLERLSGRGKQIVCNSPQTREEVLNYFGYSGTTVWLPLDTSHFRPLDRLVSRRKLGLPEASNVGMFAGSTQPTKGYPIVRNLIDTLPDVSWILALRGEVPEDLRKNDRVFIFQDASRDILPFLYSASDFTVSSSHYEAFGYVVAEALSCGTPVVATPGGASSCFLAEPPFDRLLMPHGAVSEDFVRAISLILKDSDFYRQSVVKLIRPKIDRIMGPENWLRHFCELTGI